MKSVRMEKLIKRAIEKQNVKFLCKVYFDVELTETQQKIVRDIAFQKHKRIGIAAMTRYGKTFCVSLAIALIIMLNKNKRIALIGPKREQAQILRNYMTELIFECPTLLDLAQIEVKGKERMKKEASKKRQTFHNGCEYRVYSAEGDANRLMGFGADIVIKDEACLIEDEAHAKIMRMLGDDPESSVLIELFNPWERDNKAFEHTMNPKYKQYRIDWRLAVEEGRTTKEYVMEQKEELTSMEFTILYESKFPEESEDSVFNLARIKEAEQREFNILKEFKDIEKKLENKHKMKEGKYNKLKKERDKFQKVLSCDVADKGMDKTVIMKGIKKDNKYQVIDIYSEDKSEQTEVAGRINEAIKNWMNKGQVNIDSIGVGAGVVSMVKEFVDENDLDIKVKGCHFGAKPMEDNKDKFARKKPENYFRLKGIFEDGRIDIPENKDLKQELIKVKWSLTTSGKIKIEKMDDSPDFCDALTYFIWKDKQDLAVVWV